MRNGNPGNIRINTERFKGEIQPSHDPAFKQFRNLMWGYRAIFVILNTYAKRHKLRTIRQMISRWAPSSENNTEAYITRVGNIAMLDVDTYIDTQQRETMVPLVAAMSKVENGETADWQTVERGWDLFETDLTASNDL